MLWNSIPVIVVRKARARRVWLEMRACSGLEVILPYRVSASEVPAILDRHHDWIMRRHHELLERGQGPGQSVIPERIVCACIQETFDVRCFSGGQLRLQVQGNVLTLEHPPNEGESCACLLQRFLILLGKRHLVPLCQQLAQEHGIRIGRVGIRNQSTRWGSCSPTGGISLNAKLLLLAPELARHVILHEFCHVAHRNHGPQFKAALKRLDADAASHEQALRLAWEELPAWCKVRPSS